MIRLLFVNSGSHAIDDQCRKEASSLSVIAKPLFVVYANANGAEGASTPGLRSGNSRHVLINMWVASPNRDLSATGLIWYRRNHLARTKIVKWGVGYDKETEWSSNRNVSFLLTLFYFNHESSLAKRAAHHLIVGWRWPCGMRLAQRIGGSALQHVGVCPIGIAS